MPAKKAKMHEPKIYSETMSHYFWWLSLFIIAIFFVLFCLVLYYAGADAYLPIRVLFILIVLILAVGILYNLNFSIFKISATRSSITVRYGIFKQVFHWDEIADCHMEILRSWWASGDIRDLGQSSGDIGDLRQLSIPIKRSKRKLTYYFWTLLLPWQQPKPRGQQVVLRLRRGGIEEFSFSTRRPKTLVGVIQGQIGKQVTQETVA